MNNFSLYILLILMYLGLSKSFSPSVKKLTSIPNELFFSTTFPDAPATYILIDSYKTGFLIKTYFQKYRIIHGFRPTKELVIKTSKNFWNKNLNNLGLSIYRRQSTESKGSTTPAPPGSLFIGDYTYGHWEVENSGKKVWVFNHNYRFFPEELGWGNFRPSKQFHSTLQKYYLPQNRIFYGLNKEFGTDGRITQENLKINSTPKDRHTRQTIGEHIKKLFSIDQLLSWREEYE